MIVVKSPDEVPFCECGYTTTYISANVKRHLNEITYYRYIGTLRKHNSLRETIISRGFFVIAVR